MENKIKYVDAAKALKKSYWRVYDKAREDKDKEYATLEYGVKTRNLFIEYSEQYTVQGWLFNLHLRQEEQVEQLKKIAAWVGFMGFIVLIGVVISSCSVML